MFLVIYGLTIWPSWKLLARLIAQSASKQKLTWRFWSDIVMYRLLIAAPYVFLLFAGNDILSDLLKSIIVGVLVFGIIFFFIRLFLRDNVVGFLWYIYGYTYDGLLYFYPYNHLLKIVSKVAEKQTQDGPILELGSGTGNMIVVLRPLVAETQITGVDMSVSMTAIARKKLSSDANTAIIQDDALAYLARQQSKSFEVIVLQNSLYAIADRNELWRQLRRVVKDKGSVVVSNSDRPGSGSIIKEHLRHDTFLKLLHPKLLAVGIIDMFISQFSQSGVFSFLTEEQIREETSAAFEMSETQRVYGDVNILFILTPR